MIFAQLLPHSCTEVLDLGCGTGLELDEIWKRNPGISVTGIDLCRGMLDALVKKHSDKKLTVICEDYFQYDMGRECRDAVISFESLHHFLPEKKRVLYAKICESLRPGGLFLLGDYIACCREEEELLRSVYLEKRRRESVPADVFVHFDIPLTLEHETELLYEAGFDAAECVGSINGATMIAARRLLRQM